MDSCLSCRHAYIRPASQLQQPFHLFDPSLYRAIFTLSLCCSFLPLTPRWERATLAFTTDILFTHREREVTHEHVIEFFTCRRQECVGLCSDTVQTEETQRRGLLAQLQSGDLCLSQCAFLQSHLFLSLLFALSLSVFETLSLSDTLYFICNNTISRETRS